MSDEHTSHTYLTPPSPPLVTVFFLMTPICHRGAAGMRGAPPRHSRLVYRLTNADGDDVGCGAIGGAEPARDGSAGGGKRNAMCVLMETGARDVVFDGFAASARRLRSDIWRMSRCGDAPNRRSREATTGEGAFPDSDAYPSTNKNHHVTDTNHGGLVTWYGHRSFSRRGKSTEQSVLRTPYLNVYRWCECL